MERNHTGKNLADGEYEHTDKENTDGSRDHTIEGRNTFAVAHFKKLGHVVNTSTAEVGGEKIINRRGEEETPPIPDTRQPPLKTALGDHHGFVTGNGRRKNKDKGDDRPPLAARDKKVAQGIRLLPALNNTDV